MRDLDGWEVDLMYGDWLINLMILVTLILVILLAFGVLPV